MGGNTVGKILWSSRLTNGSTLDTLPPEEYKIQYGGDSSDSGDPQLRTLFEKGLSHSHDCMMDDPCIFCLVSDKIAIMMKAFFRVTK